MTDKGTEMDAPRWRSAMKWTGIFLTGVSTGVAVMGYIEDRQNSVATEALRHGQVKQIELASAQIDWLEKLVDELARTGALRDVPHSYAHVKPNAHIQAREKPRRSFVRMPVLSPRVDPFDRQK